MKLGAPFYIVVSLMHGYVLWSYAIITPRWTMMPGYPVPGATARTMSIVPIIAAVFLINFTLSRLIAKKNAVTAVINSMIAVNIALVFTLVLSQILDSALTLPSPLMYDTIGYLKNNPSVLVAIFVMVNCIAVASSLVSGGLFVGINKAMSK